MFSVLWTQFELKLFLFHFFFFLCFLGPRRILSYYDITILATIAFLTFLVNVFLSALFNWIHHVLRRFLNLLWFWITVPLFLGFIFSKGVVECKPSFLFFFISISWILFPHFKVILHIRRIIWKLLSSSWYSFLAVSMTIFLVSSIAISLAQLLKPLIFSRFVIASLRINILFVFFRHFISK